jgi:hypothetical protein
VSDVATPKKSWMFLFLPCSQLRQMSVVFAIGDHPERTLKLFRGSPD